MNKVLTGIFITLLSLVVVCGLGYLIYNDLNKQTTTLPSHEQVEQEEDYKAKYTKLYEDYTALNSRVEQLESDLSTKKTDLETANAKIATFRSDINAIKTALEEDSESLPTMQNEETQALMQTMQEYLNSAISTLTNRLDTVEKQLADLEKENSKLKVNAVTARKDLAVSEATSLVGYNVYNDSKYRALASELAQKKFEENNNTVLVTMPENYNEGKNGLAARYKIFNENNSELADSKTTAQEKLNTYLQREDAQASGSKIQFYIDMEGEGNFIYHLEIFVDGIPRVSELRTTYYGLDESEYIELRDICTLEVRMTVIEQMASIKCNFIDNRTAPAGTTLATPFEDIYKDTSYTYVRNIDNKTGSSQLKATTADYVVYILDNKSTELINMSVDSITYDVTNEKFKDFYTVESSNGFVFIVFTSIPTKDITINVSCINKY